MQVTPLKRRSQINLSHLVINSIGNSISRKHLTITSLSMLLIFSDLPLKWSRKDGFLIKSDTWKTDWGCRIVWSLDLVEKNHFENTFGNKISRKSYIQTPIYY